MFEHSNKLFSSLCTLPCAHRLSSLLILDRLSVSIHSQWEPRLILVNHFQVNYVISFALYILCFTRLVFNLRYVCLLVESDSKMFFLTSLSSSCKFYLRLNKKIHDHNTRSSSKLHKTHLNHNYAKKCLKQNIVITINNNSALILNKIHTHSLQGFSTYAKTIYIDNYSEICIILNCYICNRNNYQMHHQPNSK